MIYYPLERMAEAGIEDVLLVSGKGHTGQFLELLKSGKDFGLKLSYAVQEEPGGIAQALSLAEDFADNGKLLVILGDNIFEDPLAAAVEDFEKNREGATIFLKEVKNPRPYGVPEMKEGKILRIIEKPKDPPTRYAVIGIYFYDNQVFDVIRNLEPSARRELEITDVNNFYLKQGKLSYHILEGWWGDGGESFDSLLEAAELAAKWERERKTKKTKR